MRTARRMAVKDAVGSGPGLPGEEQVNLLRITAEHSTELVAGRGLGV
jgi:hypothetical protein